MAALMQLVTRTVDAVLGRGEAAVTVPPMDGALQPNNELERADSILEISAPDNLVSNGAALLFSSGAEVFELDVRKGEKKAVARFNAAVSELAALPGGGLAVGLDSGEIRMLGGSDHGRVITVAGEYRCHCPTALLALDDRTLLIAEGSADHRPHQWKHDLMKKGASGSIWRFDLRTGSATRLAGKLAYPCGLAIHDGGIIVSESWRHRLLRLPYDGGKADVVVDDMPGYTGRLSPAKNGGYWLSVFAPRSQLIEFVLRESRFRSRMMTEIAEEYWVAPALSSGKNFREPLQGGAIKSMGILKPWAPTRSYGLLVKLDANLFPVASLHSRSDGRRHGITSAVETEDRLIIASKGGNAILSAPSYWLQR